MKRGQRLKLKVHKSSKRVHGGKSSVKVLSHRDKNQQGCQCKNVCRCDHPPKHQFRPVFNQCDGFFVQGNCCLPVSIPSHDVCDDNIRLRLAGLNGNLNFQFFRMKGCEVTLVTENAAGVEKTFNGRICNVGVDFVDLLLEDDTVVTILHDRISRVQWEDPDCNPCCDSMCLEDCEE